MLSSVLRSTRVNVEIMRAFVRLRQILASNAQLARKLDALEKKYDAQFKVVFDATIPFRAYTRGKEILPGAARALRLTIQPWEVRGADDFDKVFSGMGKQRPNGLYMLGSPLTNTNRKRIADFALKSLPSIYSSREFVDVGGLMTYRPDEAERYRRVGGAAHEV